MGVLRPNDSLDKRRFESASRFQYEERHGALPLQEVPARREARRLPNTVSPSKPERCANIGVHKWLPASDGQRHKNNTALEQLLETAEKNEPHISG
ncbi:hypothetical protein KIN20_014979 [Parelaphostrongylus tenuis]|uniref:Uncharacterized protein n=1 Tax=Parelaphostrongylus tenuis TaxID=148309 RepID=A0AAD5ME71_PARTN|nr:hypothetical protein KIN20_014979 [Parelaphostrongylus tenuis]